MNEKVLVFSIVENDYGSKVMTRIKKISASAKTSVFFGKGTVQDHLMNLLGFIEEKKEITVSLVDLDDEDSIYTALETKLKLSKAGHGVMFSVPLKKVGTEVKENNMSSVDAVFVVVENGRSEEVVESANGAGARGGTIIHARGNTQQETKKLFNMEIEPEQEIVLIVADKEKSHAISDAITEDLKLDEGDNGYLFVLDVTRTSGFYKGK